MKKGVMKKKLKIFSHLIVQKKRESRKRERYSEGYFVSLGMLFAIPFGLPFGLMIGNIGLGPAIGVVIGLPMGLFLEKKYNPNPIALTKQEISRRKKVGYSLIGLGFLIFLFFLIRYLM